MNLKNAYTIRHPIKHPGASLKKKYTCVSPEKSARLFPAKRNRMIPQKLPVRICKNTDVNKVFGILVKNFLLASMSVTQQTKR